MTDAPDLTRADEAEAAVIRSVFRRADSIDLAARHITGDDFHDVDFGRLFTAAVKLRTQGIPDSGIDLSAALATSKDIKHHSVQQLQHFIGAGFAEANVEWHARNVARAARRRAVAKAAVELRDLAWTGESDDIVTTATEVLAGLTKQAATRTVPGAYWEDIADKPQPETHWVVPGFIAHGDRLVVTGSEGRGKTSWLRQAAMMTAAGVNFVTGRPMEPKRCLFVDAENTEQQWVENNGPLHRILKDEGLSTAQRMAIRWPGRLNLFDPRDLAIVTEAVHEEQPDLMVIGPLYRLSPKGINTDDDAAPLIAILDSFRDRGIALMLETHMGHGKTAGGDRDVRPRGSSALLGWPEMGYGLAPTPLSTEWAGDDKTISEWIPWRGDRTPRPWPRYWTRDGKWPFTPWEAPRL